MKRIVALLIAIMVMCPVALADEITFRDIPWGANVNQLEQVLMGIKDSWASSYEDYPVPFWKDDPFDVFSAGPGYNCGWYTYAFTSEGFKVAGYPVWTIEAYSYYGITDGVVSHDKEDSRFYQATYLFDVVDISSAYSDLKSKLDSLYGYGTEITDSGSGAIYGNNGKQEYDTVTKYTTWYGDNSTAVILASQTSSLGEEDQLHNQLFMTYGDISADIQIDKVCNRIKMELRAEEIASSIGNTDGL